MKLIIIGRLLPIWGLALVPTMTEAGTITAPMSCQNGGVLRAVDQAYQDFHAFLLKTPRVSSMGKLKYFLVDIDNYEIRAILERESYVVKFLPYSYPDGVVKGGGAKYIINKCTFKIEDVQGRLPLE